MRVAFALATAAFLAACGQSAVDRPADPPVVAAEAAPCEAAIDAIGFQCSDGRTFSVRHDMTDACVVVFVGERTLMLPRNAEGDAFTDGTATFTQNVDRGTLTGVGDTPYENCTVMQGPE